MHGMLISVVFFLTTPAIIVKRACVVLTNFDKSMLLYSFFVQLSTAYIQPDTISGINGNKLHTITARNMWLFRSSLEKQNNPHFLLEIAKNHPQRLVIF